LIGHSIADGFGAVDVCGGIELKAIGQCSLVKRLFWDILYARRIHWNLWFEVVAAIILGLEDTKLHYNRDNKALSLGAIQKGSLALAAPWLNLSLDTDISGCFSVNVFEGNIRGVHEEFAMVLCETDNLDEHENETDEDDHYLITELESSNRNGSTKTVMDADSVDELLHTDTVQVELITPIFRTYPDIYRLMTAVQSGRNIAIIDPAKAWMSKACSTVAQCDHNPASKMAWGNSTPLGGVLIDEFDKLLEIWNKSRANCSVIHMSKPVDSQLKLNALLRMANGQSVIRYTNSSCIQCAIDIALQDNAEEPLRIVNVVTAPLCPVKSFQKLKIDS
jgi:hypothetical protein